MTRMRTIQQGQRGTDDAQKLAAEWALLLGLGSPEAGSSPARAGRGISLRM